MNKEILSVFIAFVSVFTMAMTGCSTQKQTVTVDEMLSVPNQMQTVLDENIKTDVIQSNHISLMTYSVGSQVTSTVTKKIVATIMPVDAPNKAVEWSVYWITNPFGDTEDVNDYITVVPDSEGSLSASIIAHKGFEGATIGVKATTRVGGFTAVCVIKYDGAPENLVVNYGDTVYESMDYVNLVAGSDYSMTLDLTNTLGAVGSKYGNYTLDSMTGNGKFVVTKTTYQRGAATQYTNENVEMSENVDYFIAATLTNNKLKITAKHSISSYFKSQYGSNGGIEWAYKDQFYDPRGGGNPTDCYLILNIKDTVSSKYCLLNVRITATIESMTLSETEITF